MARIIAMADDLSGATEAASELAGEPRPDGRLTGDAAVLLRPGEDPAALGVDVVVLDTDSRALSPEAAAAAVGNGADFLDLGYADGAQRFVKIDSLLRGSTAATLTCLARRGPLVVAPALPALGRRVVGGALRFDRPAPAGRERMLGDLLPAESASPLGLDAVRSGPAALQRALQEALDQGRVPVVDAENDSDLDALAHALLDLPSVLPVGSGGLAAALGRLLAPRGAAPRQEDPSSETWRPVAVVVGSIDPAVRAQVEELRCAGLDVQWIRGDGSGAVDAEPTAPASDVVVFASDPARPLHRVPERSSAVLARAVLHRIHDHDLVLTGGETARRMLDELGETVLRPRRRIHHGAVLSVAGSGRIVATRPGSFGDVRSLVRMISAVQAHRSGSALETTTRNGRRSS